MIPLSVPANFSDGATPPFVVRLGTTEDAETAARIESPDGIAAFTYRDCAFAVCADDEQDLQGDVVFVEPARARVQRWLRASSPHNTLLVTERCDQLCVMCSQPPKKSHTDLFQYLRQACRLAPKNMTIGLSGGEPLLFKDQLLALLIDVLAERPDLRFHVLSNAQHFDRADISVLRRAEFRSVLWGVPLYSASPGVHDDLVGKSGAFERLMVGLNYLALAGQALELRTVIMKTNYPELGALARLVGGKLPFTSVWALMQLERIGFAKNRWSELFIDHSADPGPLIDAIGYATARGVETVIYNTPLCTVPEPLRPWLRQSISDWKQDWAPECSACSQKAACSGLFAWQNDLRSFEERGPL